MKIMDIIARAGWEGDLLSCGVGLAALLVGALCYKVLFSVMARFARREGSLLNALLLDRMRAPARLLLPLFALMLVEPSLSLPDGMLNVTDHFFTLSLIVLITWLVIT